jgi:RNA polymerase sigma factor (sigma-70 family)
MSRAHDKTVPCFPETKEQHEQFENIFRNHYDRILNYLSMKVDRTIAEDLTQQVFMKAMVNLHTFREQSSLFTWIFKIAQNTLKNEYRKQARQNESVYYALDLDSQFISVDFTKNVEVRIDIQTALRPLNKLDQQIVALLFTKSFRFRRNLPLPGIRAAPPVGSVFEAEHLIKTSVNGLRRPWRHKLVSFRLFWSLTGSRLIEKRCAVKYKLRIRFKFILSYILKKRRAFYPNVYAAFYLSLIFISRKTLPAKV